MIHIDYWLKTAILSYIFLQLKAEVVKSILLFAHFVVGSEIQTNNTNGKKLMEGFPVWFPIALALNAARVKERER